MPVYLLGEGSSYGPPFSRTFFNVTLGGLLKKAGDPKRVRFTLFFTDGMTLPVCQIDTLEERYMIVKGYREVEGGKEACDTTFHLIPYGLIYRMEIDHEGGEEEGRLGFTWTPAMSEQD